MADTPTLITPNLGVATATSITANSFTGNITDTNNKELISFAATATAVNEVTVTNAAAGAGPTISATGDDTNININLAPKGTGNVIATTPPSGDNSTKVATTAFVNTAITNGTSATVTSIASNIHSSTDNANALIGGTAYNADANIGSGSRTFVAGQDSRIFYAGIDISATSIVTITLTQPAFVTSGSSTLNIQPVLTGIDFTNNTFTITTYAFGTILAPNVDFTFNFVIIK